MEKGDRLKNRCETIAEMETPRKNKKEPRPQQQTKQVSDGLMADPALLREESVNLEVGQHEVL